MPLHNIKCYEDGFKLVEFCYKCGQEGLELKLAPQCLYVEPQPCQVCGCIVCQCDNYRLNIKSAIDKQNSRN